MAFKKLITLFALLQLLFTNSYSQSSSFKIGGGFSYGAKINTNFKMKVPSSTFSYLELLGTISQKTNIDDSHAFFQLNLGFSLDNVNYKIADGSYIKLNNYTIHINPEMYFPLANTRGSLGLGIGLSRLVISNLSYLNTSNVNNFSVDLEQIDSTLNITKHDWFPFFTISYQYLFLNKFTLKFFAKQQLIDNFSPNTRIQYEAYPHNTQTIPFNYKPLYLGISTIYYF